MTASYKVLGIPMEKQRSRRRLVLGVYSLLAAVWFASVVFARTEPWTYTWTILATVALSTMVFGGSGRHGLIKPFPNKPPRLEPVMLDAIRLQLAPLTAGTPDESSWNNDERELARRDRAHYSAYQIVVLGFFFILFLAEGGSRLIRGGSPLDLSRVTLVLNLISAIALVGSVLAVTLPAAIILWNEPDIDLG